MTSIVGIYNMALAAINQSETVASTTERSAAARACNTFYDPCRKQVLEDFNWPFSTTSVYLADLGDPPPEWTYRYQLPVNCLKALYIAIPGLRDAPSADARVPYQVQYGPAGSELLCDMYQARLFYVFNVEDPERFSGLFAQALAFLIGSRIATPLAAKEETSTRCYQQYLETIQRAQVHAFEQVQSDKEPLPEFIAARN